MKTISVRLVGWLAGAGVAASCVAPSPAAQTGAPSRAEVRAAVESAVPILARGASGYVRQRGCFSCHHQALPVLAFLAAQRAGVTVEADTVTKQVEFTHAFLTGGRDNYRIGKGQGGQADTAGYALLTLEAGGRKPDETTAAVAGYLLRREPALGYWRVTSNRPPSEASSFTTTYLALRALRAFGSPEHQAEVAQRRAQALAWLRQAEPRDTEDGVFRLRGLAEAGAERAEVQAAVNSLLRTQRFDGGWSQIAGGDSDAYATGSALVALHEAGSLPPAAPEYGRGLRFLLTSRRPEGAWHVVSRSKPFQPYFESGFPYEKDQFISSAATAWAVIALCAAL